ncbi:biotin holocarboxylase synthetase [Dispira parvispora]|uniref:Biotin holocarboxylase synthetase n=1 Tax=Dispira parvispora TaxID=1520584 RepID=A0A9W8E6D4_9FUNG|nr:biotin holocarboxylase synthetase [Dispira parvispora]
MNVLVYTGDGAARTCLDHTFYSIHQVLGHHYAIIPVTAKTLQSEPWERNAALLVLPGGRDSPYVRDLRGEANDRIRQYVSRGGKYLGLCAGGYYGCERIEFEKGQPGSICGSRDLGFYPGLCRGTVYPGFVYNSESGARAVEIRPNWRDLAKGIQVPSPPDSDASADTLRSVDYLHQPEHFRMYYNGGGYFVDAGESDDQSGTTVLAEYTVDRNDMPWKGAAVVGCEVGQGRAVLTGVHPEYTPDKLRPGDYQYGEKDLVARLEHDDTARQLFWKSILAYLGLRISAKNVRVPPLSPLLLCVSPYLAEHGSTDQYPAAAVYNALREAVGEDERTLVDIENTFVMGDFSPTLFTLMAKSTSDDHFGTIKQKFASNDGRHSTSKRTSQSSTPVSLNSMLDRLVVESNTAEKDHGVTVSSSKTTSKSFLPEGALGLLLSENTLPSPTYTPKFNIHKCFSYLNALGAHDFGRFILYGQTVTSTQTVLDKNPKFTHLLPSGLVCVATHQVRGRGRGRNPWVSPEGCLQFSLLIKYPHRANAPLTSPVLLQYLIGLAMVEAVCSCPGYEGIPLRLKWPNDIYAEHTVSVNTPAGPQAQVRRVKIGGILTNSSFVDNSFHIVLGCGINCQNALPTTSVNELIREYNRRHGTQLATWSEELLLARIMAQFELFYIRFVHGYSPLPRLTNSLPTSYGLKLSAKERALVTPDTLKRLSGTGEGLAPFLPLYYKRWLHSGQVVTLTDYDHAQVRISGITLDYGYLKTTGVNDGKTYELQPGGNSFDMMAGLIGRKSN